MDGVRRSGARGGGRSSGGCGVSAAACKQASCHASVAPRVVASATDARAGPFGHRGFAGDESVRRSVLAPVEGAARARNRTWGYGETKQGLTGIVQGGSASSGKRRWWRIDGEDPRRPAMETAMVAALQRVRDLVARWGGRGGRGGASGRNGKAGQWLWPWQQRAAAVSSARAARERGQRRGNEFGRE